MRTFRRLWRGLGPGLAAGGSLLVGWATWLFATVGRSAEEGPFWLMGAAALGLAAVTAVALAQQEDAAPSGVEAAPDGVVEPAPEVAEPGSDTFRARTLPWVAAGGALLGAAIAWSRLPEATPGSAAGPAWPAALTGFLVAAVGFVLLGVRGRTARRRGGAWATAFAVVVAVAVPVGAHAALESWTRERAADVRVLGAPPAAPPAGAPQKGWELKREERELVVDASVPVMASRWRVEGLDPATGRTLWWLGYGDRELRKVETWNDRLVVTWDVYPTIRNDGDEPLRSLVDAGTGRVLAEITGGVGPTWSGAAEERHTFVGDRVVRLPNGCEDAGRVPGSGMIRCGQELRRIDARGRQLWTADTGGPVYVGPEAVLLAGRSGSHPFVALNPDSGEVLWRSERRQDDFVGVTDGVAVWRDSGKDDDSLTLTGVDVRTGSPLWTRNTGLDASSYESGARARMAAGRGYVDVVHSVPRTEDDRRENRTRPGVTRLNARDGTAAGPAYEFPSRPTWWPVPRPTGSVTILLMNRDLLAIG